MFKFNPTPWRVFSIALNAFVLILTTFYLYKEYFKVGIAKRTLSISAKYKLFCLVCIWVCQAIHVPQMPMLYHQQDYYHPNYRSFEYQCLDMTTTICFVGLAGVLPFASCYRYVRLLGVDPSARLLGIVKGLKIAVVSLAFSVIVGGFLNNFFDPDELSEVETWPELVFIVTVASFTVTVATIDVVMNIKMAFYVLSRMSIHAAANAQTVKGTFSIKRALQFCFALTIFFDVVGVASFLLDNTGGFAATSLSALHAIAMFKLLYYIKKGSEIEVNQRKVKAQEQKRKQLKKEEKLEMEQQDTSEVSSDVLDSQYPVDSSSMAISNVTGSSKMNSDHQDSQNN